MVVLDCLIDPPRHRLPFAVAATWLVYPLLWFGYTLARGAGENWYPYPFVDVKEIGYGGVFWRSAIMLVAFAGASVGLLLIGNARRRKS